eukprot:TRINITY_DN2439_c0_g1_i1.p1 TRINITY_DN2439_c0_g1~~TRINITY_DN2439_c0_g1_i1.p1  ORF type:complete len:352 (-),score=104.13 TRINITY_DN2439_c0_g1_i1:29-1084(-)
MGNKHQSTKKDKLDPQQIQKMEEKRSRIVKEILSTEQSYGDQIKIMIEFYMKPMSNQKIVKEEKVKIIFGNIDVIYQIHLLFLESLQKGLNNYQSNPCISQVFLQLSDAMKLYSIYINGYDDSMDLIERKKKEKKKFDKFLKEQKVESKSQLDLFSLLIVPIQRLPRYVLLLEELLKSTWEGHSDYEGLQNAIHKIRNTVEHVNETKRKIECQEKLVELQNQISCKSDIKEIVKPTRIYELEMEINLIDEKETISVLLVVFNDSIMVSKKVIEKKKDKLHILFLLYNSKFDNLSLIKNEEKKFKVSAIKDANDDKNKKVSVVNYIFETKTKEDAEILIDKLAPRVPARKKL